MSVFKKILKEKAPSIFSGFPVLFAYLYGSCATGNFHKYSDIDVGVFLSPEVVDREIDLETRIALAIDGALEHQAETDVRAINDLPLIMKGEIVSEGLLIYTRDDAARVEFETRVRMAYFDFLPTVTAYHAAYIDSFLNPAKLPNR